METSSLSCFKHFLSHNQWHLFPEFNVLGLGLRGKVLTAEIPDLILRGLVSIFAFQLYNRHHALAAWNMGVRHTECSRH